MNDSDTSAPAALLLVAPGCPHCPAVLQGLSELVKDGTIGHLEVFNIASRPDKARELGVRSVPWLRLGPFELTGQRTPGELRRWAEQAGSAEGMAAYLRELLAEGRLPEAEAIAHDNPVAVAGLLQLMEDLEAPMQVRVGIGAVLEALAGSETLQGFVEQLGELSRHEDHRLRSDACHYLGLTSSADAVPHLKARLDDDSPEVREIARDSLEELGAG